MIIPKRFKLDKAASAKPQPDTGLHLDAVFWSGDFLMASNGSAAVYVPVLGPDERLDADLPRREDTEMMRIDHALPLPAVREAVKGKTGLGTLRTGEHTTEAQAGPDKPVMRIDNPVSGGHIPNFDAALDHAGSDAPPGHRYVEVCLDAQLLAGVAAAIGAEEAVRLRFLVNEATGQADAAGDAHGVVDVRPVREPGGGQGVLMINVVS